MTTLIKKELMPFQKFVTSVKNLVYDINTIRINGTFKEISSGRIIEADIFDAHRLGKLNIKEIYKVYLEWFNHTREEGEKERTFVSVKLENYKEEEISEVQDDR